MKRTYHTDLLIKYKLGVLDRKTVEKIPKSTLFNWRQRDFSHIFGLPDVNDSDIDVMRAFLTKKKLLQAAKALYYIFSTFQFIVSNLKNKRKMFSESTELILKTIERTKDVLGFERVLKVFDMSPQTYYYRKNKLECETSFLNLCKKRHPLQLTSREIVSIKKYLTNVQYLNWSLSSVYFKMMRDKVAHMGLVNKRIKYDFLFPAEIQNFAQTVKQLEVAVEEYNNKPYQPLYGLTPNEVFAGNIPDKTMFKSEIAAAKTRRITENKANLCFVHK